MKAKLVTYKCMKHLEGCIKEWDEYTVEDPPYFDVCKSCYAKQCEDERELASDCD
jgi:hypothetical protein